MTAADVMSPAGELVLAVLAEVPGAGLRVDELAARMPRRRGGQVIEGPYLPAELLRVLRALERGGKVRSTGKVGGPISWSLSAAGVMDRLGWLVVDVKPKEMYL